MNWKTWAMTVSAGAAVTVTTADARAFFPPLPVVIEPAPVVGVTVPPARAPIVVAPVLVRPVTIPAANPIPPVPPPPVNPPVTPPPPPPVDPCPPPPPGVPEPGTVLSGLTGLAALGLWKRARGRK